ncbi:MAG: DNA cytosine methyltransferase [Cytophagales bacterium]|nr:MAG: DNA cytosine methyltransferase [Cytophagales bacterium]
MSSKKTYIDLFSGAGGFSKGFEDAGFQNFFSIDIEPNFCKTYRLNFPNHTLIQKNITELSENDIVNLTNNKAVDVVVGGPPCQGFSMAGNIGRTFAEDSRNQLFKEFVRIVAITQPNYFIMENVARLYTHNNGKTRIEIENHFKNIGYNVISKVLNFADYGVPQTRKRVIFIGKKRAENIFFPEKLFQKHKSIETEINNYPILKSGERSEIPNHVAMNHSEQMLKKMSFIPDGGNRQAIPDELRPQTGDVRKYIRYKSDLPSVCITGDMRKIFHYSQNRALTVRELAKIQTFPDSFIFKGSSISQQQQVGNAVPPLMAEILAKNILKMMEYDS